MRGLFFQTIVAALGFASLYTISAQSARADEWGCQVILCLSNPGGPTQYGECRPPIEKLWAAFERAFVSDLHGCRLSKLPPTL